MHDDAKRLEIVRQSILDMRNENKLKRKTTIEIQKLDSVSKETVKKKINTSLWAGIVKKHNSEG